MQMRVQYVDKQSHLIIKYRFKLVIPQAAGGYNTREDFKHFLVFGLQLSV